STSTAPRTWRGRCSSSRRTAPRCRCSWCIARASSSTATTRRSFTATAGFTTTQRPAFRPPRPCGLCRGAGLAPPNLRRVFALANLRGGGEFGEEWHKAGTLDRKQNVFDDFIACAEWLVDNDYTRPERLAIQGGSNGGLLTAACALQRPDLYGAVLSQVPVSDMLRYQQ